MMAGCLLLLENRFLQNQIILLHQGMNPFPHNRPFLTSVFHKSPFRMKREDFCGIRNPKAIFFCSDTDTFPGHDACTSFLRGCFSLILTIFPFFYGRIRKFYGRKFFLSGYLYSAPRQFGALNQQSLPLPWLLMSVLPVRRTGCMYRIPWSDVARRGILLVSRSLLPGMGLEVNCRTRHSGFRRCR